jgi:hypothetical protein
VAVIVVWEFSEIVRGKFDGKNSPPFLSGKSVGPSISSLVRRLPTSLVHANDESLLFHMFTTFFFRSLSHYKAFFEVKCEYFMNCQKN